MYTLDLHLHTDHSDGDYSPEQVAEIAHDKGLRGAIVTDHNVVSALDTFTASAHKYQLECFDGIEISTKYQGLEVHVLGYSQAFKRDVLAKGLRQTVQGYNQRFQTVVERLQDKGYLQNSDFELMTFPARYPAPRAQGKSLILLLNNPINNSVLQSLI